MPHAAWRISSREWQPEYPAPASDRREPRALLQRRDRSLPCAQQRRVVCTRSLPLSLLRTALHARRVDARPRDAAVARRPGYLGKGGRSPQQAGMPLLAVPYKPSWVEHLILSNRNILADQMEFLVHHLPRDRRPTA